MDAVSQQFKAFCDERRLKAPEISKIFRISQQTVLHWRSQGIPARRQAEVVEWMAARQREEFGEPLSNLPHRTLVVDATAEEWHAWEQAALASGQTLTDWAHNGLLRLASEKGFGDIPVTVSSPPHDPIGFSPGKVDSLPPRDVESVPFGINSPGDASSEVA